jgi:hypothetical protein
VFQADPGGWNNIRMALEVVILFALVRYYCNIPQLLILPSLTYRWIERIVTFYCCFLLLLLSYYVHPKFFLILCILTHRINFSPNHGLWLLPNTGHGPNTRSSTKRGVVSLGFKSKVERQQIINGRFL